jgi:hypothetical protein
LAPFFFSFKLILKRDYTNVFRGGWKVRVVALQTLMKFLLLAVLYLNAVLSAEELMQQPDPIQAFILVQTPTFSNVAGNLMPALLSVALSSTHFPNQCLPNDSYITKKQTPESTLLFHIS